MNYNPFGLTFDRVRERNRKDFVHSLLGFYGTGGIYARSGRPFGRRPVTPREAESLVRCIERNLRRIDPGEVLGGSSYQREVARDMALYRRGVRSLEHLDVVERIRC